MPMDNHLDEIPMEPSFLARWAESLTPVTPPEGLRGKVLARIRNGDKSYSLRTIQAHKGWVDFIPGVRIKMLYRDDTLGTRSFLARLEPGVTLPPHEHDSAEECLVLEGEITLGDIPVRTGDYHFASKGAAHGVTRTRTGALLFLRVGRGQHVPEPSRI
jgi:quercetin dioxygenase-like cupin family protein